MAIKEVTTKKVTDLEWTVGEPFEVEPREVPTWEKVLGKLVQMAKQYAKEGNGQFGTSLWGPLPTWAARNVAHGWHDQKRETDQKTMTHFVRGLAEHNLIGEEFKDWNEAQKLVSTLWSEADA